MKQRGWVLAVIPVLTWAQMSISTVERVSMPLSPDVLQGSMSFEEQSKNSDTIKTHLNAIVAEIKRQDPQKRYCRGGGYQISPMYSYKDQKQEFTGYSGSLSANCEFETIEQYNTLVSAIDRVSAPSVRKRLNPLRWQVSAKADEASKQQLRTTLLEKIVQSAQLFSRDTKMDCEAVSVRMTPSQGIMPMRIRSMAMMDSVPTESPIQNDEESSLEANVDYNCSMSRH